MKLGASLIAINVMLAGLIASSHVQAEELLVGEDSMQVGNVTVSVGGGTALLSLPGVAYTVSLIPGTFNSASKHKNSEIDDEIGWALNGAITLPINPDYSFSVAGFYAAIEDSGTITCPIQNTCGIPDRSDGSKRRNFGTAANITTNRDVDHWSGSIEVRRRLGPVGLTIAGHYVALGADMRAIDQDIDISFEQPTPLGPPSAYAETLDARYYGGFVAWGGTYTPLFLSDLWSYLGLQSSFRIQGGLYHVETKYQGVFVRLANTQTTLSRSRDDIAFVGGLTLETRKKLSARTVLFLRSDYEYYSWVPDMTYDDVAIGQQGLSPVTRIDDDDAFSMRTSLCLTIGLGPDELFRD